MSYEIRHSRITNSDKLTDRYLTTQIKLPSDQDNASMGRIYVVVEITNPWFPNSQIGQSIINTLTQEYFKQPGEDTLDNFENALRKVNQNLYRITQEGETDWMGNLNAVFIIINNDQLFLSKTGKGEAFLFRNNSISNITNDIPLEKDNNPIKTFSDIISGEINKNDKLLISSPALLDYLSQKEIHDIISENSPYESSVVIADFLIKEKAKHVNAAILEILSKIEMENLPLEEKEVVYLDKNNNLNSILKSTKNYSSKFSPYIEKISGSFTILIDKTKLFFHKEVNPRAKNTYEKTKSFTEKSYNDFTKKTAPEIKNKLKPFSEKIQDKINKISLQNSSQVKTVAPQTKINSQVENLPYSINRYDRQKPEKPTVNKYNPWISNIKNKLEIFYNNIKLFFGKLFSNKNQTIIYIVITLILISTLAVSIVFLKQNKNEKAKIAEQQIMLQDAEAKYEEAKLAILYNNKEKARNLLDEVIKNAMLIMNDYPELESQATDLINKSNEEFDKLTSTTRFNDPSLVGEFPDSENIFEFDNTLYALGKSLGSIYQKQSDGEMKLIEGSYSESEKIESAGYNDNEKNIFLKTDSGNIYEIKNKTLKKIDSSDQLDESNDISVFTNNIYLLDSSVGQIWKLVKSGENYLEKTEYFSEPNSDIVNSLSIAIDGNIFVLGKDYIHKYNRGKKEDFTLNNIPEPNSKLTNAKKIYTNSDINSIYILDENRIIEFDKDGKFLRQYGFPPEINNISSFFINTNDKKIWVLDNNRVFMVEY